MGNALAPPPDPAPNPARRLPPLRVPLLYFLFGHLCLAAAAAVVAAEPAVLAGRIDHPHLVAAVHLVTVGWITGVIFGSLYLVAPMALRARIPGRPADGWGLALTVAGTAGLTAGFWRLEPALTAASGGVVMAAAAVVCLRTLPPILRSPTPPELRAHYLLSWLGLLLGGVLGIALAAEVAAPLLADSGAAGGVGAHAHLLLLGWVLAMVLAAGYRLLPMLLPSAMPEGVRVLGTAAALAAGTLVLAAGLAAGAEGVARAGGALALTAVALFLGNAGWMLRNPRPRPKALPLPDLPVWHVLAALLSLAAAAVLGAVALFSPGPAAPGLLGAYGVLAMVGFLSQMIVGVGQRLVPWLAWMWAAPGSGFRSRPPAPHAIPHRGVQAATVVLWFLGVPVLAAGSWLASPGAIRTGALLVLLGTLGSLAQVLLAARLALSGIRGSGA